MSQWGKLDRFNLTANVVANLSSTTVVADTGVFTTANNVQVGYSLLLGNVAYRINAIPAANTITLEKAFAASNVVTATAAVQQSPKDILTYGWASSNVGVNVANLVTKQNVYGVDRTEIGVTTNKANGFSHTGWVHYHRYTDTYGRTRHKSEVLVAMSKNFNANTAGSLQTDANDGAVLPNS